MEDYSIRRLKAEQKARELRVPFVDLSIYRPDASAVASVPQSIVRQYEAVPVKRDGNVLYVALASPDDKPAVDAVRQASRCTVRVVMAMPEDLQKAIERLYGDEGPQG